jgi:hypothetical protein
LIWLEPNVVDRLRALRGRGEDYSQVIPRLAGGGADRLAGWNARSSLLGRRNNLVFLIGRLTAVDGVSVPLDGRQPCGLRSTSLVIHVANAVPFARASRTESCGADPLRYRGQQNSPLNGLLFHVLANRIGLRRRAPAHYPMLKML